MGFANKVSLSRILVIPFFVASLIYYARTHNPNLKRLALALFIFAMITDIMDGIIARVKKQRTPLGRILDPLADKFLLLNAFIWIYVLRAGLALEYKIPLGVIIIVVSRDAIIILGIAILSFLKIDIPIIPNVWGKLTTFFQMFTILSILLELPLSLYIWGLACVFTVVSGFLYLKRGVTSLNAFDNR